MSPQVNSVIRTAAAVAEPSPILLAGAWWIRRERPEFATARFANPVTGLLTVRLVLPCRVTADGDPQNGDPTRSDGPASPALLQVTRQARRLGNQTHHAVAHPGRCDRADSGRRRRRVRTGVRGPFADCDGHLASGHAARPARRSQRQTGRDDWFGPD